MNTEIIASYPCPENTSVLVARNTKGFAVVVKDEDSGFILPTVRTFPTLDGATVYAKDMQSAAVRLAA